MTGPPSSRESGRRQATLRLPAGPRAASTQFGGPASAAGRERAMPSIQGVPTLNATASRFGKRHGVVASEGSSPITAPPSGQAEYEGTHRVHVVAVGARSPVHDCVGHISHVAHGRDLNSGPQGSRSPRPRPHRSRLEHATACHPCPHAHATKKNRCDRRRPPPRPSAAPSGPLFLVPDRSRPGTAVRAAIVDA